MASTLETRAHMALEQQCAVSAHIGHHSLVAADFRPAKFPMTTWMRFNVRTTEDFFSVPQETAMAPLRQVGRLAPARGPTW